MTDYHVRRIEAETEFKVCPTCGYEDGFHSMFRIVEGMRRWFFICPRCHAVFDIGLTA